MLRLTPIFLSVLLSFVLPVSAAAELEDEVGYDSVSGSRGKVTVGLIKSGVIDPSKPFSHSRVCLSEGDSGEEVPCHNGVAHWYSKQQCYGMPAEQQELIASGLPLRPGWTLMRCLDSRGAPVGRYFSIPDSRVVHQPPDPEVLARRAVDSMGLVPVEMGSKPQSKSIKNGSGEESYGLVGIPSWMWVKDPSDISWGPITAEASLDGYTVRATAKVRDVVWDMGNGDQVRCALGTPYQRSRKNEPSPDCGYTYVKRGNYTLSATSTWDVEWMGIGRTGSFSLELSDSYQIKVGEAIAVNTVPKDGP